MALALPLVSSKASQVKPLISARRNRAFDPSQLVEFNRHDSLPTSDNSFWRIESGYVRTFTWSADGDPIPLGFWKAGDIVGPVIAQVRPYEVQCLSPVTASHLGRTYAFPREAVLAQVRQTNELLRISHCRQAEQSLLTFLCWLADRFGQVTDEGIAVPIKLIHQDIADSIGVARVTVTRLLKKLDREGQIRWSVQEKVVYRQTFAQFFLDTNYQLTL
ncbi:MAG: Crp/Fnr family transcriptional regulator [Cyanobacteria bacterium P01_F01_bin.53]